MTVQDTATADTRLYQIAEIIAKLTHGDLEAHAEPSDRGDELDAIIRGLNRLGATLSHEARRSSRLEEALRRRERDFQALLEAIPDMVIRVRKDGTWLDFMPQKGWKGTLNVGEHRNKRYDGLLAPDEAAEVMAHIHRALETGEAQVFEQRVSLGGEEKVFLGRIVPCGGDEVLHFSRKITRERRETEALRQSEERFRLLAENALDAIYRMVLEPEPHYEYMSPAIINIVGYAPEEFYADPDLRWKMVHPDDVSTIKLARGQDLSLTFRCLHKDGHEVWVEVRKTNILGPNGEFEAVEGIMRDVTETKRAEEKLRESEELYRSVTDNLNDGIAISIGGRRGFVNRAYRDIYGIDDEVQAADVPALAPVIPEDYAIVVGHREARLRGEAGATTLEYRVQRPDGAVRSVEASGADIVFQGQPARLAVIRDVTERRRAEAALRESHARLERLLSDEQTRAGVLARSNAFIAALTRVAARIQEVHDPELVMETIGTELHSLGIGCVIYELDDANTKHTVLYSSLGMEGTPEEREALRKILVGRARLKEYTPWYATVVEKRKPAHNPGSLGRPLSRTMSDSDRELVAKYADRYPSPSIQSPLIVHDQVFGTLSLWGGGVTPEDLPMVAAFSAQIAAVWENARLLQELQRNTTQLEEKVAVRTRELAAALIKAQDADRLKSELLSAVSHELRTPLAVIKGYCTTLIDYGKRVTPTDRSAHLKEIDGAADRLMGLIGNLLDYSRLGAGMLPMDVMSVWLEDIVDRAVDDFRVRAVSKHVVVDMEQDLPCVIADPRRIREVIDNLLNNALKYTPEDRAIWIECRRESMDDRAVVLLTVRDDGPGIAPEEQDLIFQPFHRIDIESRIEPGVGLGLAICRRIVDAHDGRIWVESSPGSGAKFKVALPQE